jgi:hypothetical protein
MEELREKLVKELEELSSKGELSMGSLDAIDKLTHSIKSIDTILAMSGYSGDEYSYGRSYKRDSMGRYARDNYSRARSYDGYSRDDSKREISETLKELSRTAKDGESKRMIEEWMREIEN